MAESTLHKVLLQIAKEQNIQSPNISIEESPNHGYLSNVHRIVLKDANSNTKLHLFAKEKPEDVKDAWHLFYINEAVFYNKVVGGFCEVLTESEPSLPLIPKCYFASANVIVLEDLLKSEYKLWNPLNQPLDSAHVKTVLQSYGKFHAFSFALKHKHPEKFKSIGNKFEWGLHHHQRLKENGYMDSFIAKLVNCFDRETESHYIKAVSEFYGGKHLVYLQRLFDSNVNDVFIHGDSWTHNYMFQYDNNAQPRDACILDFQLFRKTSPIVDLSYFLAVCACTEEFFNSIWDYLKVYHQSLEKHLVQLNCPTNVYTWETFKDEWQTFSMKGVSMAAIALKMMVADKDELELREDLEIPMKFDFVSRNEELYKKRMRIVIKYFYHAGLFKF